MGYIVEEIEPVVEPILLADMKNWLKIPPNVVNDDGLVAEIIQSAREEVEGYTGRSLITKGYRQSLDSFPYFTDSCMSTMAYPPAYYSLPRYSTTLWNYSQLIKLLRGPLLSVSSITYSDSVSGEIQSLYPALFNWTPLTEVSLGYQIEDPYGNIEVVSAIGSPDEGGSAMTGAVMPFFSLANGHVTFDGGVTWTNIGPVPDAGDFIYDCDNMPPRIFPLAGATWPPVLYVPNAVQIHFIAGYGNSGDAVPARAKQLMRKLAWDAYFNREPVAPGTIAQNPSLVRMIWSLKMPSLAATRG
jgi:hypothetical protein